MWTFHVLWLYSKGNTYFTTLLYSYSYLTINRCKILGHSEKWSACTRVISIAFVSIVTNCAVTFERTRLVANSGSLSSPCATHHLWRLPSPCATHHLWRLPSPCATHHLWLRNMQVSLLSNSQAFCLSGQIAMSCKCWYELVPTLLAQALPMNVLLWSCVAKHCIPSWWTSWFAPTGTFLWIINYKELCWIPRGT